MFSAPEDDRFAEVIIAMRKSLGWITEIPRHGPGCKEKMAKLKDKPVDQNDEEEVMERTR